MRTVLTSTKPNDDPQSAETDAASSSQGEAEVAAVLDADKQSTQAEASVEDAVSTELNEALTITAEAPAPTELEILRGEIRDIEDSVAEKQAEVRRSTVAQLQVQQAKLRGELEDMLARDLSELDAAALRRRVVQLVMELQASIFRS